MIEGFKPMLAGTVEEVARLPYPLLASPKLDGVRALVSEGVLLSRNLKPIPNKYVQALFGTLRGEGLDGELIVGDPTDPAAFRNTSSGVMAVEGKPDAKFYVFDNYCSFSLPFETRYATLPKSVNKHCVIVQNDVVRSPEDLTYVEDRYLELGYEGVMLRKPSGLYKHGRSTLREAYLLKLKRFLDSEAVIIGFEEQMHNANEAKKDALGHTERSSHKAGMKGKGTLGALVVMDIKTKVEFNIGTGFDDATRATIWAARPLNKIVKYRYFPTGSKDKPRFPTFLGFRDPMDF